MWTLVFIVFIEDKLLSNVGGSYETMYACFNAREELSVSLGSLDGFFPPGSQAVCVYRDKQV